MKSDIQQTCVQIASILSKELKDVIEKLFSQRNCENEEGFYATYANEYQWLMVSSNYEPVTVINLAFFKSLMSLRKSVMGTNFYEELMDKLHCSVNLFMKNIHASNKHIQQSALEVVLVNVFSDWMEYLDDSDRVNALEYLNCFRTAQSGKVYLSPENRISINVVEELTKVIKASNDFLHTSSEFLDLNSPEIDTTDEKNSFYQQSDNFETMASQEQSFGLFSKNSSVSDEPADSDKFTL